MLKKDKLILLIILLVAFLLRFWQIGSLPYSLNWDEVSHGYNAYSILETGLDQWGQKYPIFNFRAYGDYPTTLNLYLTAPFIKVFGLNSFSIRLPHAIISFFTVIFGYFLAKIIFKNRLISLSALLLFSISPWTVFPSRAVFQSNLSLFLFTVGLVFFFYSFSKKYLLLLSAFFFGISLYSYHNARIAVPLICLLLVLRHYQILFSKNRFVSYISLLIFLIFAVPNLLNLFSPESQARSRWVGIINPNSINIINESRRLYTGPPVLNRVINNKIVYFSKTLITNYLDLVNPFPLFFWGSENYQFNPPKTGLIFIIFAPFFYIGLYYAFKKYFYLILLFVVCLLPSALTVGDFPSIRATLALPFYFIFISLGLSYFKKYLFLIYIVSFASLLIYINIYLNYLHQYSQTWQYGYQPMVEYIRQNFDKYDKIYITKKYGEPHEFILFYWPWNPGSFLSDTRLSWDYHSDWYWVNSFDKFVFINDWDIPKTELPGKTLLITSSANYSPGNFTIKEKINFLNNTPAFEIVSYD